MGEKVRSQYSLLNIRHCKLIRERLLTDLNRVDRVPVTLDGRSIRGSESGAVGTFESLGVGRGDYGDYGASVDQPFLVLTLVCNV